MATRSAKSAGADVDVEENVRAAGINGSNEADDAEEVSERLEALEEQLREVGDRLLDSAKTLSAVATRQMQSHPMAAFGVAFLAGMTFARLMRR